MIFSTNFKLQHSCHQCKSKRKVENLIFCGHVDLRLNNPKIDAPKPLMSMPPSSGASRNPKEEPRGSRGSVWRDLGGVGGGEGVRKNRNTRENIPGVVSRLCAGDLDQYYW